MIKIWFSFYNFIILPVLYAAIYLLGIFNDKIKRGIKARKTLFADLETKLGKIDRAKKTIWFHSSSMGEFEQAKPIIEKIKKEKTVNIIVTFFSPSGYENSLKYPYADVISYLPLDTPPL
ncbi:MAG: 3-deoxy-D-manno-octulosonic acid transferase, partial [Melioribacteraceae bacterium]